MKSLQEVVDSGLCISCGSCNFGTRELVEGLVENKAKGVYEPKLRGGPLESVEICPGAGYLIKSMGEECFPKPSHYDKDLGCIDTFMAAKSTSHELMKRASSGAAMTAISKYMLENGIVDGVVTTKLEYSTGLPRPQSFIAKSVSELIESQGSKYCPVPILSDIRNAICANETYLFIGTPCQVAGLRLHQKTDGNIVKQFPYTMANFCGGYRDLRETDTLIRRAGLKTGRVKYFQYRGDGQPGYMKIEGDLSFSKSVPYPEYARATGYIKHLRCRLCVDATGELADFSCGDAWIPRFLDAREPWSILLGRSPKASKIIREMVVNGDLITQRVSLAEIKLSQSGNLNSKKTRQSARIRLYKLMGYRLPTIKEGYNPHVNNLFLELKVHMSHQFFNFLEKTFVYTAFAKLIKRYPRM